MSVRLHEVDLAGFGDPSSASELADLCAFSFNTAGYFVVRNAISVQTICELREDFARRYADCMESHDGTEVSVQRSRKTGNYFWVRQGRVRIHMKLEAPFSLPEVLSHRAVDSVLARLLGSDYYCKYYSSDTPNDQSILQSPHRDIDFVASGGPLAAILNVPLVASGKENGPLEIWPGGSHLWQREFFEDRGARPFVEDARNPPLEALLAPSEGTPIELSPGDLLVRDPGMIHRGTPNRKAPRFMLTIGYARSDFHLHYGDPRYNFEGINADDLDPGVRHLFEWVTSPMTRQYRMVRSTQLRAKLRGKFVALRRAFVRR